jgi:hypothetical protein
MNDDNSTYMSLGELLERLEDYKERGLITDASSVRVCADGNWEQQTEAFFVSYTEEQEIKGTVCQSIRIPLYRK